MHSASAERCVARARTSERGSATAELAVALPAVVLVLAVCLAAVMLAAQQVRLTDAAADAARALGRGEPIGVATSIAARVSGPDVAVSSRSDGEYVCATLTVGGAGLLSSVGLTATSCALGGGR